MLNADRAALVTLGQRCRQSECDLFVGPGSGTDCFLDLYGEQ